MAQNVNVSVPSASDLLAFVSGLDNETRSSLPNEDSQDFYPAVVEAFHLAQISDEGSENTSKRKSSEARMYTVLILRSDGKCDVVGSAFGTRGREATDPKKMSELQKLHGAAELQAARLTSKGTKAGVVRIETSQLPEWIRSAA